MSEILQDGCTREVRQLSVLQSETPLMAAAVAGHKACVKALLADPMLGASASMTQDSLVCFTIIMHAR